MNRFKEAAKVLREAPWERPKKCRCGNDVTNKWGTCDECQDAAYAGDALGRW